jgi:hypothetical protein
MRILVYKKRLLLEHKGLAVYLGIAKYIKA